MLQGLWLNHNRDIGDDGTRCLAGALTTNTSLARIRLSHCSITATGVLHLVEMLRVNCAVTELGLSGNWGIGDAGAAHLARALRRCPSLRVLDLDDCGITAAGARLLAEAVVANTRLALEQLCGVNLLPHLPPSLVPAPRYGDWYNGDILTRIRQGKAPTFIASWLGPLWLGWLMTIE